MTAEVGAKRLGLLRELLPGSRRFGLLANSSNPLSKALTMETQAAAQVAGLQIEVANAAIASEIEIAFDNFRQRQIQAVVVAPDTLFINRRTEIAALTLRYVLPAVFPFREDVIAGGLMSYGPSITDNARMAGVYAGRVLRGESRGQFACSAADQI